MVLSHASERGLVVQVVGGGTPSGYGDPPPPDIVVSTAGLSGITAWEPDDMTLVVGAGAPVAIVESELAQRNQTMVLPEHPGAATIGGVVASGVSSLRRGRLYGTRERVLETVAVTGDGRIVRSGGRVVKNVTGYDLSRLHVGAFGALGVVVSVCLKLWPVPPAAATVTVGEPGEASKVTRPLAVIEEPEATRVFLWGTDAEVEAMRARFPGGAVAGLDWPHDPIGEFRFSLRVPPGLTADAVARVPEGWRYLAVHGVGEIRLAGDEPAGAAELRDWAESVGGHLVMVDAPRQAPIGLDPWGAPPPALDVQRRLISQFDPARVINPGRLPGGL
jgi:glycolate oxidase FAD binding subunit